MVAYGDGLAVDFGVSYGVWYYKDGWWNMTPADPEWLGVYSDKLVSDFGSQWGLWEFDGESSAWSKISSGNADTTGDTMVDFDLQ